MRSARPGSGDLRLRIFAALFFVGIVAHEFEFALEQEQIGPLGSYLEHWRQAVPTVGWSSSAGLAAHLGNVAFSLLAAFARNPRGPLSLLAVTFVLSQIASPDRTFSHSGLIGAVVFVILAIFVVEWGVKLMRQRRAHKTDIDWDRWTLTGLAGVAVLTYFFAFFLKLNPNWLSPTRSQAPDFLLGPSTRVLEFVGMPAHLYVPVLSVVAIFGTLAIELTLPVMLLWSRTRLWACLMGVVFHLVMIQYGVADFPALLFPLYIAFFTPAEASELVSRMRRRPSAGWLAALLATAAAGAWAISHAPKLRTLAGNSMVPGSMFSLANAAFNWAVFVFYAYVGVVLLAWIAELWMPGTRRGDSPLPPAGNLRPAALPPGRQLAPIATVATVWLAFVYINVAPFFGFPAAGTLVMYSGMSPRFNNHLLMPRFYLHDSFTFADVVAIEGLPHSREGEEFRSFVEFLHGQRQRPLVLLNVIRYHVDLICRSASDKVGVTLSIDGVVSAHHDVCAEASMRKYGVIPQTDRCVGSCTNLFRGWARGTISAPRENRRISDTDSS